MNIAIARQIFAAGIMLALLGACTGGPLSPPPAEIGDATITVTVKLTSQGQLPKGATATITVADISAPSAKPLAGDTLSLGEADRSFRVTLPADKRKLGRCRQSGICAIFVYVSKNGQTLFSNKIPTPYKLQKQSVTVAISAR